MAAKQPLIERYLPIDEISIEAIRERAGAVPNPAPHQLHVWWARRPLTPSRAAIAASLLPERTSREEILSILGSSEDLMQRKALMDLATINVTGERIGYSRKRAFSHNPSHDQKTSLRQIHDDPLVLDVTAGGGSIPFEAGRLGLRSTAIELNPVAGLILHATCRWPQLFGYALLEEYKTVEPRFRERIEQLAGTTYPPEESPTPEEMRAKLQSALDANGESTRAPVVVDTHRYRDGYLWARTVECPSCGGVIPLSPKWKLNDGGKGIKLIPDTQSRTCGFAIVNHPSEHSTGTINRAVPTCPYPDCFATAPKDYVAKQAQAGKLGEVMYAISYRDEYVFIAPNGKEKKAHLDGFRTPTTVDDNGIWIAQTLEALAPEWEKKDILPNEKLDDGDKTKDAINYGMPTWASMFNPRQQLVNGYCVQAFRELIDEERTCGQLTDERKAAWCYIAIALDKMLNRNARLGRWIDSTGTAGGVFDRHDFGMVWSHFEMPITEADRGLSWATSAVEKCLTDIIAMAGHQADMPFAPDDEGHGNGSTAPPTEIIIGPAQFIFGVPDASVECIVFDPPYHNNVNYAELSDFFYVWLKRTAGYVMPELFPNYLTDKANEAIASPARLRGRVAAAKKSNPKAKISAAMLATEDYLNKMEAIFQECRRVIKPADDGGIMTVMFTHRDLSAWDALLTALIAADFNVTRVWPVKTEAEAALHIKDKAAARTTMLIVCRPRKHDWRNQPPSPWAEVEAEIGSAVRQEIPVLASYNFRPVDIYNAAYGPALKVISENWGARRQVPHPERLTDDDPYRVTPTDALEVARREVTRWRMAEISQTWADSHPDPFTAFYILSQDGAGSATMPFDEANLFAKAIGMDFNHPHARRIAEKKKDKVTLVSAKQRLARGDIDATKPPVTALDQVHTAIALTERSNSEEGENWLTWNGVDIESPSFKGTIESLLTVLKPRHDDYEPGHALYQKLYTKIHTPQTEQFQMELAE